MAERKEAQEVTETQDAQQCRYAKPGRCLSRAQLRPGRRAAQQLGRLAKGVAKTLSPAALEQRRKNCAAINRARKKKGSGSKACCERSG